MVWSAVAVWCGVVWCGMVWCLPAAWGDRGGGVVQPGDGVSRPAVRHEVTVLSHRIDKELSLKLASFNMDKTG